MHPFAAATARSLVLLLLLLFSLSTTQSLADANSTANNNYYEISPISTDSHINQVIFDPDHHNSSLPLLIHNNNKKDQTFEFNVTALPHTYLMTLHFLTKDNKVVKAYVTPDTGSDLIWLPEVINCETSTTAAAAATEACIEIKKPEKPFRCQEKECETMWSYLGKDCIKSTNPEDGYCGFKIGYMDKSYNEGYLGKGRFRFGDSDGDDHVLWMKYGVSRGTGENSKGVVGLGRGKLSLFQQLNKVDEIKFSYCLPQHEEKDHSNKNAQYAISKLVFGSQVNTNPHNSTPLLDKDDAEGDYCETRFYCVKLRSIYVKGGEEIKVKEGTTDVMIIDSGSTFTTLRGGMFESFLEQVKQQIGDKEEKPISDDYMHCFLNGSAEKLEKVSLGFERTTVEPKDELKVELKRENIFDPVKDRNGKDYLCLTVQNFDEGKKKFDEKLPNVHILGSRAQMDFEVKFDVPNKKVSFDKVDTCNLEKKEKKNSNDVE